MANSKGISYGAGNRGQATILDSPSTTDVLALRQQRLANEAVAKQKEKENLFKEVEIDIEAVRADHTEQQIAMVNNIHDFSSEVSKNFDNMSEPQKRQYRIELNKKKNEFDAIQNRSVEYTKAENAIIADAKTNSHLNYQNVDAKLKSLLFDENRNVIPIEQLSEKNLKSIYNDPEIYNGAVIVSDFVEVLNDSKSDFWKTQGGYDEKKNVKSNLFKFNDLGKQEFDLKTGKPILNVTTETLNLAKKEPDMALQIQFEKDRLNKEEGRTDATDMDAFQNLISPIAYKEVSNEKQANEFAKINMKAKIDADKEAIIAKAKAKADGIDEEEANAKIFYRNLDLLLHTPNEDPQKSLTYYINNGEVNTNGEGNVIKPVVSELIGTTIGNKTVEDKKTAITITGTYHDYTNKITYYETSDEEGVLKVLNRDNASDLVEQIGSHDANKEGYIQYGIESGYVGEKPDGTPYYNKKITDSESLAEKQKYQEIEAKTIETAIGNLRTNVENAIADIEQKREGKSFYNIGFNEGERESFNTAFSKIPKGISLKVGGEVYKDPKITIESTGWGFQSDTHIFINGVDTGITAGKEGIDNLLKSITITRKIENVTPEKLDSKRNSTSVTTPEHKPKTTPSTKETNKETELAKEEDI